MPDGEAVGSIIVKGPEAERAQSLGHVDDAVQQDMAQDQHMPDALLPDEAAAEQQADAKPGPPTRVRHCIILAACTVLALCDILHPVICPRLIKFMSPVMLKLSVQSISWHLD